MEHVTTILAIKHLQDLLVFKQTKADATNSLFLMLFLVKQDAPDLGAEEYLNLLLVKFSLPFSVVESDVLFKLPYDVSQIQVKVGDFWWPLL
jgi:hypothetical protein